MYHSGVIRRLYVHNFRCFENFELRLSGKPSSLLMGRNGAGKSTVGLALEVFQQLARGTNRVRQLMRPEDFTAGRVESPMRFEIEIELDAKVYEYSVAFDLPFGFRELRVFEERLIVDGRPLYTREVAKVHLFRAGQEKEANFSVDWHLIALPIIQEQSKTDPLYIFKNYLRQMVILQPIPSLMDGNSDDVTLQPSKDVKDFGNWFSGLLADYPAAYGKIDEYLKQVMPDLKDIKNPLIGTDSRSLEVQFEDGPRTLKLPFSALSWGEKCFMVSALVVASNSAYGPLLCFWDEPDNHLAIDEVGHFVMALRKAFQSGGQFIATSHNPEAIQRFSDENTFVLSRNNHFEPTVVRPLSELNVNGDLVGSLVSGDLLSSLAQGNAGHGHK